jgi:hypothetical protein
MIPAAGALSAEAIAILLDNEPIDVMLDWSA